MITGNCRAAKDTGDQRSDWKQGGFSLINHGPDIQYSGLGTALIYVHGFSNKIEEVLNAYDGMCEKQSQFGISIYGFTWPSEGNWRYFSDLLHVRRSKKALHEFILNLRRKGYSRIVLQCHSMGSILVMEMLTEDYCKPKDVQVVIIHGGDASRKKFKKRRKYGSNSFKLDKLVSMWSKNDRVLRWARIVRPARRVGRYRMHKRAPDNFTSQNYSFTRNCGEIRHSSYRKCKDILQDSVQVALHG